MGAGIRRRLITALAAAPLVAGSPGLAGGGPPPADPLNRCAAVADDEEAAGRCAYCVSLGGPAARGAAAGWLAERGAASGSGPWLDLYLGRVLWRSPETEDLLGRAEQRFHTSGDRRGELTARLLLIRFLSRRRPLEESVAALGRAAALAGSEPERAAVRTMSAYLRLEAGEDLAGAYRDLQWADAVLAREDPALVRKYCLSSLIRAAYELGRNDLAARAVERMLGYARQVGDDKAEAAALYSLAAVQVELGPPSAERRELVVATAGQALEVAVDAGHRRIEAASRLMLARFAAGAEPPRAQLERCLELTSPDEDLGIHCRLFLAEELRAAAPARSRQLVDEALASMQDRPWALLYGWSPYLRLLWAESPPAEAVARSRVVLERIEALREDERSASARAEVTAAWSEANYWLAGRLLRDAGDDPVRLAEALRSLERMRARALLDTLDTAAEAPADGALALPDPAALPDPGALELSALQSSLGRDTAVLSYQVHYRRDLEDRPAGGAWLLVVTADGARAYELTEDRLALEGAAMRAFLGLPDPDLDPETLTLLHRVLLGDALAELPAAIRYLVIVPDGSLHLLPWAALRESPGGEPLIERYRLTLAPSAALWLHWRTHPPAAAERPLLALADPALPASLAARYPPLPRARREARAAARLLGAGTVHQGAEATAERLADETAGDYAVLHLAAHAVVDGERPARSAVLLAPAAAGGCRLGPGRIERLRLRDQLVVLSACETAAGKVLRGEGPMSLARSFFLAGARVVVASQQPLEDRRAERLFTAFYRRLAAGHGVAAALAGAQRQLRRTGEPAAAWATVVALGDGDLVPFPGGVTGSAAGPLSPWLLGAAGLLALAGIALLLLARAAGPR